ncbi:hypothetical protein [Halobacillus sp. A5]|uniref:hypothetical protein n=1 Tax=Halobacillus sp. A5 TaxID=2880263 RepID=UPI0020A695AD|nr:hypothetical protein [Halobacillus sp. A5]MCP3028497.1 hypothetical protein [Halobacillus sp. A5]
MLKLLKWFNFIGNFMVFHYILGKIYFYRASVDSPLISLAGLALTALLSLLTTLYTFHHAQKVYTRT